MRKTLLIALAVCSWAASARGEMVVQRWGTYRYTQHKGVTFAGGEGGKVMKVDLSALAKGAKVHRARLVFTAGKGYEVAVGGKDLKLVEPYCLWFDATEAVRAWVANGKAWGRCA